MSPSQGNLVNQGVVTVHLEVNILEKHSVLVNLYQFQAILCPPKYTRYRRLSYYRLIALLILCCTRIYRILFG